MSKEAVLRDSKFSRDFMFDEELVYKRFMEETNNDDEDTILCCRTLKTLHPALMIAFNLGLVKSSKILILRG